MKAAKIKPAPTVEPAEEPMLRSLDRWWFGYGSPTSLGIFRILIGAIIFLNLMMLLGDWGDWFGENGYMPSWLGTITFGPRFDTGLGFQTTRINLIAGVTDPRIAFGFFILTAVFAVLTAVGLFTRVSSFLLALFLVTLCHRNTSILHGGDTMMRISAIYLAVSSSGRACSLDRLIRLRRGEEEGPVEVPLYGQRLVQFNLGLIYFTTVWAKWFGTKWVNGTATWYPARLPEFYRFPVPGLFNDLPFVYFSTYGTILTEFSLATLVFFRPLRKWVLIAGVLLHAYIEYSMNIPLFSFLMISAYVTHYQGEEIAAFCKRLGDRLRPVMGLEVTLPPGRRLTANGERFLHAVDPFGFVRYLPARDEGPHDPTIQAHLDRDLGWDAKKDDGKRSSPFRGVAYRSPGAWLFMLVPGVWRRIQVGCLEE